MFRTRVPDETGPGGRAPAAALAAVLCLGLAASLIANWPGHFMPDSLWQLGQGKSGVYNDWHPPVMAWLLGLADRLVPGAPLFFVFDTMMFFGALAAFMALRPRPGIAGIALLALIAASPLVLIYQGLVLKDVLFADASLAGFAALAWAGRLWNHRPARIGLVAAALPLLTLAMLARQNGVIVAVGGALALGAMAVVGERPAGAAARRFLLAAVPALALMGAVFGGVTYALEQRGDHSPEAPREFASLQLYDLAGAARRDPSLPLPVLARDDPALERFIRHAAVRTYDAARIDRLVRVPGWEAFVDSSGPAIGAQWRGLITASPLLYLKVRAEVFRWVFMTPDVERCAPVLTGVDPGDPELLRDAGMAPRETAKDDWDSDYGDSFLGAPVFSHVFYAALALVLLVLAVRDLRREGAREMIAVIALLGSALAFTASFFVISIACDYRYLYFLDAAAMVALLHRAAGWRWRARRTEKRRLH